MQKNNIIPDSCACCQKEITSDQPIEALECCVIKNPQVAHQSCVKNTFDSVKCSSCGSAPTRLTLLPKHLQVIMALNPLLVEAIKDFVRLSNFVQLVDSGWTSLHFLARYGSLIPYQETLRMLQNAQLFETNDVNVAALGNFARLHHQNIFGFILDQFKPREAWRLVTEYKIVKSVANNTAYAFMMVMLIDRLMQEHTCFDPLSDVGKQLWQAFVNNAHSERALIKALSDSTLLEHKLALARLYHHGVKSSNDKSKFKKNPKKALKYYLQIIDDIKANYSGELEQLSLLNEACCYVKKEKDFKTVINIQQFNEIVHLLAGNDHDDKGRLVFIFVDYLLQNKMSVDSVCEMIDVLLNAGCDINGIGIEGNTLLNILCVALPSSGLSLEEIMQKIEYLKSRGARTDIANHYGDWPLYSLFISAQHLLVNDQQRAAVLRSLWPGDSFSLTRGNQFGKTLLYNFIRHLVKNAQEDSQILDLLRYFLGLNIDMNVADDALARPQHLLMHLWIQRGLSPNLIFSALRLLHEKGAELEAISSDYHSVATIVGREWVCHLNAEVVLGSLQTLKEMGVGLCGYDADGANLIHHVVYSWAKRRAPVASMQSAIMYLIEEGVNCNAQNIDGQTPLHIIFKMWLTFGYSLEDIMQIISVFFEQSINLNLCDNDQDTLTLMMLKGWRYYDVDFEQILALLDLCILRGIDVNAVDLENNTLLHYVLTAWIPKIKPSQFLAFLELACKHRADFNIEDMQKNTPVIYLFLYAHIMRDSEYALQILKYFKEANAKFEVLTQEGVSFYQMVVFRSTPDVLTYLLPHCTPDHIIHLSTCKFDNSSLFNCLSDNLANKEGLFERLCLYLLSVNAPLSLDIPKGRALWRNLQRINAVNKFHEYVREFGSVEQLMNLARYHRNADTKKLNGKVDLGRAANAYDFVMSQLLTAKRCLLSHEHVPLITEISEFEHSAEPKLIKVTKEDLVVLNLLLQDNDAEKALQVFERAAVKTVFSCIVWARYFEKKPDIERACHFYQQLLALPLAEDSFTISCRQYAFVAAKKCYNSLPHPSTALKEMLGKLSFELGEVNQACDKYDHCPALLERADKLRTAEDFIQAANDYCRIILSLDPDSKIKWKAVDGLVKISNQGKLFITIILDTLIQVIDRGNYDHGLVEKILSAYGVELLFSDKGGKPPESTNRFFKPFKNILDSRTRVHSTIFASICRQIISDELYEAFKQTVEQGTASPEAIEFIRAIADGKSTLPTYMLNAKFMTRIEELQGILSRPQNN